MSLYLNMSHNTITKDFKDEAIHWDLLYLVEIILQAN